MKISRNTPCPCGSGKKYKRCCGADTQPYDEPAQGTWAEQLSQAIEDSGASTIEEMNAMVQRLSAERNTRPVQAFLGLSPAQMAGLLYKPLESPELVTFNEDWFPEHSIALQLFDALATGISKDGVKATSRGNLPIQLCRDILANTPEDLLMRPPRIRTETEFDELHTLRVVGELAGLIEQSKTRFVLSPLGQKLTQPDRRTQLFHTLLKAYATKFNWGYRDGYADVEIIQTGWLFSLYCLSSFGAQWRPCRFYAEKFVEAFPMALNEIEGTPYTSVEEQFHHCYQTRTLVRFARFWGLIDIRKLKTPDSIGFDYEVQAPRLSDWLQFHA
ncbi:MAG: SEC-C metal-binding domain-containing protein [Candidatus Thiodiazotropha endolucinida]